MNFTNTNYQYLSGQLTDEWFQQMLEQAESTENLSPGATNPPLYQEIFAQPLETNERGSELLQSATVNTQPSHQDLFQNTIASKNPKFSGNSIIINSDQSFPVSSNTIQSHNTIQSQIPSSEYFPINTSSSEHSSPLPGSDPSPTRDSVVSGKQHKPKRQKTTQSSKTDSTAEEKIIKRRESNRQHAQKSRDRKKQEMERLISQTAKFLELGRKMENYAEEYRQEFPSVLLQVEPSAKTTVLTGLPDNDKEKDSAFEHYLERVESIMYSFANALTTQQLVKEFDKERIRRLEMENAALKSFLQTAQLPSSQDPSSSNSN